MTKNRCCSLMIFTMLMLGILLCLSSTIQTAKATENGADDAVELAGTSVTWEPSDFTYTDVNQIKSGDSADSSLKYPDGLLLYGCDYSRQFYINGKVVTGFSTSGSQKFATCKDVVIPRCDDEGNTLVGVGPKAFYEMGITSVKFPTGMKTDYVDNLTKNVTKRGNFVIFDCAFEGNNLTDVNLPEGVIACMVNAFYRNSIKQVTLPRTIWWLETQSFGRNQITDVNFPQTTDFQMEMHGMAFANNKIKQVRLPDFTAVVNKDTFFWNPGMEAVSSACPNAYYGAKGGVVYMYTDNGALASLDRIHTTDRTTTSTKSWVQKLITTYNTYTSTSQWLMSDFTYTENKTTYTAKVTGLSASGIAKRKVNPNLVIPEQTPSGCDVTEIAGSTNTNGGLFATSSERLTSVTLSTKVTKVGDGAFKNAGLEDAALNNKLVEIGKSAFEGNNLTSVVMSDTVTTVGERAFANNKNLEAINFSSALTEIPASCFASDASAGGIANFKKLDLRSCVTKIGKNAFEGNNFESITIPSSVKEIEDYAFATLSTFDTTCEITLADGLKTIGERAFKNKNVEKVDLPQTVRSLPANAFEKDLTPAEKVWVYSTNEVQTTDKTNFPNSDYHEVILLTDGVWLSSDFTFAQSKSDSSKYVVTGFSEQGKTKLETNKNVVVPAINSNVASMSDIKRVDGIEAEAFKGTVLETVEFLTIDPSVLGKDGSTAYSIGDSAFENCSLQSAQLPSCLTSLGAYAFANNSLTEFALPEGLSTIGKYAFQNNSFVKGTIPGTVKTISEGAFANSAAASDYLASLELNDGTEIIESKAFAGCKMTESELPTTVTSLALDAFGETKVQDVALLTRNADISGGKVSGVKVTGNNYHITYSKLATTGWKATDFKYDGAELYGFTDSGKAKRGVLRELVLPDYALDGTKITSIDGYVAPTKVQGVVTDPGEPVFSCPEEEISFGKAEDARDDEEEDEVMTDGVVNSPNGFTSVQLPAYVQTIGKNVFRYNNLTAVDLPNTVKTIGNEAFKGNKLEAISLSDNVTSCGEACFATNNITSVKLSANLTEIPNGMLSNNIRMTSVTIPEKVTKIGQAAFAGARLTSLTIPKNVTYIGRKAFHLHHLTGLTIPGNVKTIEENAFEGTYKAQTLKKLTIANGVETIGKGAFKEGLLTSVEFPASVKTLGAKVFENNTGVDPANGNNKVKIVVASSAQKNLVDTTVTDTEYVVWKCTVTFNSQGGSSVPSQTVESGSKVTKPSNPTRSGYTFVNWYSDSSLAKVFDFNSAISADVTLYAKWQQNATPAATTVTMWRLYNQWSGEHLYTSDSAEYKNLGESGWTQEGEAWIAPVKSNTPVYRLYNPYSGDHHFTTDKNEYINLGKGGWRQEGVGWYSAESSGTPIYRLWNPYETVGTHHFTKDSAEYKNLSTNGWRGEGIAWYGVKNG